jgi:hypothetical protein
MLQVRYGIDALEAAIQNFCKSIRWDPTFRLFALNPDGKDFAKFGGMLSELCKLRRVAVSDAFC